MTLATALSLLALLVPTAGEQTSTVSFDIPGRSDATPSVAAAGSFVAVAWGASGSGADVFVAVSRNGGKTFGTPVQVNRTPGEARLGGELPPRVALHATPGGRVPTVVVIWTAREKGTSIKIARSADGGATFDKPVTLQSNGAAGDRGWPALAIDGRGEAHVVWLDHRGLAAQRAASGSAPKGAGSHRHHGGGDAAVDGAVMAQGSALYHASLGASASAEQTVTSGVCYCCKTALAAGPDGSLIAAWRHVYAGDMRDIATAVSRDGGRTFSTPARVNEDGWAIAGCPDDGPSLVVDATGTTHIVWPTVVGGDEPQGALFYATTSDGRHFTSRVRIPTLGSPKPSHPQLSITSSGRLIVAWDELIEGRRVSAIREVKAAADGSIGFGNTVRVSAETSSHPVMAAAGTGVFAVWSTGGEDSRVEGRAIFLP